MRYIYIPHNVPSAKNSKVKTEKGIFMSKSVRKYLQKIGVKNYSVSKKKYENYKTKPNLFAEAIAKMKDDLSNEKSPHVIAFHFIRDSKRKFDFHNAVQIVADLLVSHGVIPDDDMDNFIPEAMMVEGLWYKVDKEKAGVIIGY